MIQFINQYPESEEFSYAKRISLLRERKLEQTREKIEKEGGLDEDDYGRVVKPDDFNFEIIANHSDGSFYGYSGWTQNYVKLLSEHPLYCDPLDAFVGRGFFFLIRYKGSRWNPDYPYDELQKIFERYNIISGIGRDQHFTPDLAMGLELGWGGILKRLEYYKAQHDASHHEFFDSETAVVKAIIAFLQRVSTELYDLAGQEQNPTLSANLKEMADVNAKIADGVPGTMREAIQWMCWFSFFSRLYNRGSSGGQLDMMLRSYYERDIAAGRITDDDARFFLACLFLNDTRYYQLGGPDNDGNDMTSHLSFLILEAANMINIPCNLTVRVHDKLNEEFFRKSVEYLFENRNGWPRYSGDKALVEGFMRCGYPRELAQKRLAAGCHWMSIPGMEYTLNDVVKINLAKVFEVAYYEMIEENMASASVEKLYQRFSEHLKKAVEATTQGIEFHLKYQEKNEPELILNLLSHGPVEKGVDVTRGATYFNMCMDGAGLATVADSFAACEQRIERERRLSFRELTRHLDQDFNGRDGEYVRQMLQHSERYGQGDSAADRWAVKITRLYSDLVRQRNDVHPGLNFIPGWFSWANTLSLGNSVAATPNGRRGGEAINHGANPNPGFRRDGAVTAMANSIAGVQPGYGNTAPVQLELDPGIGHTPEAIGKMSSMIRTILNTGNTLLNINIIDEQKILDADRDPAKYPDLVVRVTGFTAYFSMLSPEFRKLVVDRILSKN